MSRQGQICLQLPCKALAPAFEPSSESRGGFLGWPKTQLPLNLLIALHVPFACCCCPLGCCDRHRVDSVVWRLQCPPVRRQPGNLLEQGWLSASHGRNRRIQNHRLIQRGKDLQDRAQPLANPHFCKQTMAPQHQVWQR